MNNNNRFKIVALFALIVSGLGLSIAYSSYTTNLKIESSATVTSSWKIIWSDMQDVESSNYASVGSLSISTDEIDVSGNLGTLYAPGDSLIGKWYVYNKGEINAKTVNVTKPTFSCAPSSSDGATVEEASTLCDNLELSLDVEDWGSIVTGKYSYALDSGDKKLVTMTLTYKSVDVDPLSGGVDITIDEMPMFDFVQSQKSTEPSNCIIKGSKISIANGLTKNVEDVKVGDEVLGYNYYEGNISSTKVYSIISGKSKDNVFKILLENGKSLQIVGFEYLFDVDSKLFIPININKYKEAIGKNIMINNNGNISYSRIVSIKHDIQEVEYYTMYTEKINNYIANDMIVHIHVNFVNDIFEIGNDYKINYNKYNNDIKKYGLFKYDDFKDICSKDLFDKFDLKNYSFVIGKNIISYNDFKNGVKQIQEEINFYSNKY